MENEIEKTLEEIFTKCEERKRRLADCAKGSEQRCSRDSLSSPFLCKNNDQLDQNDFKLRSSSAVIIHGKEREELFKISRELPIRRSPVLPSLHNDFKKKRSNILPVF